MPLPATILAHRGRVAESYLAGDGIEIGALDSPIGLPHVARVKYIDFRTVDELTAQYPNLDSRAFVPIDIVDDGEHLTRVPDGSLDFLIANHMLEHCENPLGTLNTHLRKVKPGGWLFYAVPDMRCCFDSSRPLTTFAHVVADELDGGTGSRYGHFLEWARLVNGIHEDKAAAENARQNIERRYSIHYHVWDSNSWLDFLVRAREHLENPYELRHFELAGPEMISILRRS